MNKLILVTGSTSGFGNGLVKELLKEGHRVIATGRNLSLRGELLSKEREKFPNQLYEFDFDVTSSEQRSSLVNFALSLGGIDVLINNAGFGVFGPLETLEEEKIRQQFEVNFFGPTLLIKDFLPQLRKSKGTVVNLSSVFGFLGFPLSSPYCASKFALEGLTESLSYELAPHEVSFVLIQPGGYKTNFSNGSMWTQSNSSTPPIYDKQIDGYTRLKERQEKSRIHQDPQDVVRGILTLLKYRKKSFRYTFGLDATFSRLLRGLLPRQWFHSLATSLYKKIFWNG